MKRRIIGIGLLGLLALMGCVSFDTNLFRTEQTAVNTAYAAYAGWTNYLATGKVSIQASNEVKQARLHFAASVGVVENYRAAYATNSAVKPQAQAALDALVGEGSNVVWLITYWKGK